MKYYLKLFFCTILLTCTISTKSYAYFDPGTGSFIVQAILGFLAAGLATAAMMWSKFKLFLSKIFNKKVKKNNEKKDNDINDQ
tara:strand:+ start:1917 stop:2165 length:249 start_codon:yes stop_codon:yes gene_type:complete